jgi:SH3 domain protein
MRFKILFVLIVLMSSYLHIPPASAETRYVVDELIITLRAGKSSNHKILKSLTTGTPLEVLGEEDDTYVKVRTPDGVEGYVLRQYISTNPPKKQVIAELKRQNASLQKKIQSLEEAKSNMESQLGTIEEGYDKKFSEMNSMSADMQQNLEQALNSERSMSEKYNTLLAQAENVVEIVAERDQLLQQNKKLNADVTLLTTKNDKLSDSRMIKWFLAGGGVFFFGWIIGKISKKKRSRL